MRADRLLATLLILQAKGRITAPQLAAELEVSVATARRDLEALGAAGIPVYAQPGRGGGWHLVGGARTDLTGLTADEATALFTLLGSKRRADAAGKSALGKLLRALPETFRADAEAAARAVVVDASAWGGHRPTLPPHLEPLRAAIIARHSVRLSYAGQGGESTRDVDPWALIDKGGHWYLLAGTAAGRRTFRIDRIVAATTLARTFERPPDLDVEQTWEEVVEEVETRRGEVVVGITAHPGAVGMLRRRFGRQAQLTRGEDGAWSGTVAARDVDALARSLASFAQAVTLPGRDEESRRVRARLVEIGTALVHTHSCRACAGRQPASAPGTT